MYQKVNIYLKEHPIVKSILLIVFSILVIILMNAFNHEPQFNNFDYVYDLIFFTIIIWVLNKTNTGAATRLMIGFFSAFVFFSVSMFLEGSYINYSSFIVVAMVSALLDIIIVSCSYLTFIKHNPS